jgi:two-component system, cell cycle sensor histidine kinase and response regulator CckA
MADAVSEVLPPDMPAELLALRQQFVQRLPGRLDDIHQLTLRLITASGDASEIHTLHRMVHSLTGTAGTFGLPALSIAARELESRLTQFVQKDTVPSGEDWSAIRAGVERLRCPEKSSRDAARLPLASRADLRSGPKADTGSGGGPSPLIHLVQDDPEQAGKLAAQMRDAGYRVCVFDGLEALRVAHARDGARGDGRPDAVVLDTADTQGRSERAALMNELGLGKRAAIPLITTLVRDDLASRLSAARAGVNRTLTRPLQAACVVEALDGITGRQAQQSWRVLMVDDDSVLLEAHASMLRAAGMEVQTLSDPMKTLDMVRAFDPDVLLLDVYMPDAGGPEIAAALRAREAHLHLPILFLSAETDMTQQLLALNLGGDDFLIKPVQPEHLVAAVTARARRARQNIAVQRRLETTLYEREREHLALNQHAIVSIGDGTGRITYVNDMFCHVTGYQRDELVGNSHRLVKSDVHPTGYVRSIWDEITEGRVWQGELCSRCKDGALHWSETTITPFLDAQGNVYQYVVIQTDTSHIKAAKEFLRKQGDMQRTISEVAARLMSATASQARDAINLGLKDCAVQLGADRAFLFGFSKDGERMGHVYTWCAPGHAPPGDAMTDESLDKTPWMRERFLREGMVVVPDVKHLPSEASDDRRLLENRKVGALLVAPLHLNGQLAGFISFSAEQAQPDWSETQVQLLKVLSEVLGSAMARRRAEVALRESEARLNFLVSSSPVTIYTCAARPPYAPTYVSPNVTRLLGFQPDEFLSHPNFWADHVHPEDLALVLRELPELFQRGEHHHEYRLLMRDGHYRWIHSELRLVRSASGRSAEIIGYWMDITERKRIEQELFEFNHELERRVDEQTLSVIESERIAQATLDALSSRVLILDEYGFILAANRAWNLSRPVCATTGKPLEEGANYLACMEQDGVAMGKATGPILAGIRAVIEGRKNEFFHEYADASASEPRWFVCRVEPFPGDGAVRVVVSHEDITQSKLAERQQMRSQRLESLGTLAGGVAHDLNNALAPVLMGMELLKADYPQESKVLGMVQSSAQRGADMVRQLLTFAKGADGERVKVQPERLVRELESLMKGSFPKSIVIKAACDPKLAPVIGDVTQLHQILLNLCVNARDAMPNGGELALTATMEALDAIQARSIQGAEPGRYVVLRVADTGTGIPPEVLERIFDPFFTTKSPDKGTGLGLSTVLGIIRSHGGFVQVDSTPGEGAAFSVYLPPAQDARESVVSELLELPPTSFHGQGERILFVDDEGPVREIATKVLERLTFTPLVATDGADALILAAEHKAELRAIVTDLHMPHMDGLVFVRALRRFLPDIPVVLASGRVDETAADEFRKLGVVVRLDKPFTEDQLAQALRVALAGH